MADFISLPMHPDYPAIPVQAVSITPDSGCAGCALAQTAGHRSCSSFRLQNNPATVVENRIDLTRSRAMQTQVHNRAFYADGIVGGSNGQFRDTWYYNNAGKAVNFVYFSGWTVTGVTGDIVSLAIDGDAKSVTLATWKESRDGFWVNGFYSLTAPQSMDMLEFQYPSKASSLKCKILQVTESTDNTIKVKIDKNISSIWNSFFDTGDDPPETVSAKLYQYGREREDWTFIVDPHFFLGSPRQKVINAADLETDGIWELETVHICPPESIDPLNDANWILEGYADSEWTRINEDTRLHINETGARVALKTTLPEGSIRSEIATDLTETYDKFRVTYYVATTIEDASCSIRGFDRCFNSLTDKDKSVGAYLPSKGIGITADLDHVYCHKRVYEEYEVTDEYDKSTGMPGTDGILDTVAVTLHHPTGLDAFPTDTGKCIQYGYCNKWENSLSNLGSKRAPFSRNYMAWFLELWFAADKRRIENNLYVSGSGDFTVERLLGPGILWLNGYYGNFVTSGGFHPQAESRGDAKWFTKKPRTIETPSGEGISTAGGLESGFVYEYDEGTDTFSTVPDIEGNIPAGVAGFKTKRDPFDPAATVSESLLEFIGAQVERDTGILTAKRGLSGISMALAAETIVAPGFDLAITTKQNSFRATFEWDGDSETDGLLTILSYAQEGKETSLGSQDIHSVTSLGDHEYQIDLVNTTKTFSQLSLGSLEELGDSYDEILSVEAGGGPLVLPYEYQELSSYDGNKNTGSRAAGLMPLDCIEINGFRFVVKQVLPHGGSEAATWGNRSVINKGFVGGYLELPVDNNEYGFPLLPITITEVERVSDSAILTVIDSIEKPASLAENECWFDGSLNVYFSPDNDADNISVSYSDSLEPTAGTYTESFTVAATFTVDTQTDYTEWTGADTKAIYLGATAATVTVGGATAPVAGGVRVNDNSGKIQLTFNIADAPNNWKMLLTFDEEATAPGDHWNVARNYTSVGKFRDAMIVIADPYHGGGDYFTENSTVGETLTGYRSATVSLPTDLDLRSTQKTVNDWQSVGTENFTPNAASGKYWISGSYLATLSGVICFQLPDIQMIDNRGQVPASIFNKTEDTLATMNWVETTISTGFGSYEISLSAIVEYGSGNLGYIPATSTCEVQSEDFFSTGDATGFPNTNFFYSSSADSGAEVYLKATSDSFGIFDVLNNLPDGCTIEEAIAEISGGEIETSEMYQTASVYNCEGELVSEGANPEGDYTYNTTPISCDVIAFTGTNSFIKIGEIEGAGNGTIVGDITEIAQYMYANRKNTSIIGYGVFFSPLGFGESGGELTSYLQKSAQRSATVCTASECYDIGDSINEFYEYQYTNIEWGTVGLSNPKIKVNFNGKDKLGTMQPRFPAMIDLS